MKKQLFILSLLALTLTNIAFGQDSITEFLKNKQNSNSVAQDLEAQVQNYIRAVINQDAEEVYKFIHPDYVKSLKGKDGAMEFIESEFEVSKKEDFKIVGVKIKEGSKSVTTNANSQKIKVAVAFQTEKGVASLDGEVTAISVNNNWYFVHQKTILESFGVKEFEETPSGNTETANALSSGVVNGKAISLPAPEYPKAARAVGATGAVNVEVVLDEEGNVISAEAVSGHALLRQASEEAAKKAKFKPTLVNGQARKVTGTIVYNFSK